MKNQTSQVPVPLLDSPDYMDWLFRDDPELDRADRAYFRNGYVDRTVSYRNDDDDHFWGPLVD